MRKQMIFIGLLLAMPVLMFAQSARLHMYVTYTGHSEYGQYGGDCWETGTEEYTGKVWFWTDNDGTWRGGSCRTCDNNGNCGNGNWTDSYVYRFQSGSWLDAYLDGWEDDSGGRCDHNSGDDCRTNAYLSTWTSARNYRTYARCTWNYLGGGQNQFGDDDNWAQIGFYWEYEGNTGTFTANGSTYSTTICSGQSVSFSHSGYYGKPRYWIGSVSAVGNTSPASWNECNECYDNQANFSHQFNTPGVYLIRTHCRSECSDDWNWGNYQDRWVTVNATPAAPQALGNVLVGTPSVLADGNITSSGACCGAGHEAFYGRVFDKRALSNWSASSCCDVTNQYLQFDLGGIKPFNGVATQGRHGTSYAQWVGTIDIQFSMDGSNWVWVPGGPFPANSDNNTVVTNMFGQYHARYVRIWPRSVSQHITLRGEVISIPEEASTVTLTADIVGNATTARWYNAASGGTLLHTGQEYTTPVLSQNTTYYVAAYNATTGCESTTRTAVIAKINTMYGAGPAGMGSTDAKSDLKLWLNANAVSQGIGTAISQWNDLSGNGNHATQGTGANQPALQTQVVMNGQKTVRFTTDDIISTGNFLGQYEPNTVFSAARLNGGQNQRLISSSVRNWLLGYWSGYVNVHYAEGWMSGGGCSTGGSAANTNAYIHVSSQTGRNTALYSNGTLINSNNCGVQSPGGLALGGGCCPGNTELSNGDIGEIITFNKAINNARRNIIENYLAAKYNIGISNDLYAGDGVGDCDYNVAGIGRDTEGWHLKSRSGGMYVNDGGFLQNNGDYLLFGHTNSTGGWETSDLNTCTGNPTRRLSRVWYLHKTDNGGNGGNVTLTFNAAELGLPGFDSGTYKLASRAGSTGNFATVATGTYSSSTITFTLNTSTISNGQYTLVFEEATPGAISFNGNTYVTHSTAGISGYNGTVMGWVRPTQTADWGFWQTHDANGSNWSDWISMFSWVDGTFYFRIGDGSAACCNNDLTFSTATYIPNNQWTHLAFTWGGGLMTVYVNGTQIAQRSATFQGNMDPYARIGQGHDRMMKGLLDEIAIYNTALNATQIQALMHVNVNNGNANWGNLLSYYKMNENSTWVLDMSKNNNNGTRTNGAYQALYTATPSISGSTSECINNSTSYTASLSNAYSRVQYNWSVTGGTINSGQGTSQINVTWTASGTQSVNLTITHSNECHTETAAGVSVSVSPATVGGTVYPASQTICTDQGFAATHPYVAGHVGNVVQWEYKTPVTGWINWGGTSATAPGNCCFGGVGTWQVRALIQSGPCTQVYSSVADIIVVADPVAPTISPSVASGTTVCTGAGLSANIGAGSGGTGTITDEIQYTTNGGANWFAYSSGSTINASGTGNDMVQIRTRRTATGSNCDASGYNVVSWHVVADPAIGISTPNQNVCYGAGITLNSSTSGGTGSCTYQWQSRPVGSGTWTNLGTAATQATGAITTSTEYQVVRNCNGLDCNTATSGVVTLTVITTNTWTGAAGSGGVGYWDVPGNWSCGIVPNTTHNVTIPGPGVAPNQPVVRDKTTYGTAECKTLNVAVGANIINQVGAELRVTN